MPGSFWPSGWIHGLSRTLWPGLCCSQAFLSSSVQSSLSDHWSHKLMWAALVSAMWFSEQSFLDSTISYVFFIYVYVVLQESKNFLMICTKYYFFSLSLGWHILMDLREAICGRRSNPWPRSGGCVGTGGPRGATPCSTSGRAAMRRYPSSKVRETQAGL